MRQMMFLRLSEDARESVLTRAAEEMHCTGASSIGSDHMLLGVLHDPASGAADALGIDLEMARAARAALDRAALAAVGIKANDLESAAETSSFHRLPPLTSGARAVFRRAIELARPTKTGQIRTRHFLEALLLCEWPDPAAQLLRALNIDPAAARARLEIAEMQ
jgi:ATP-dependent Clp protease ATP-binding subunit ClpA